MWCQDLDRVKEILATNNDSLNTPDLLGWTALHLACCSQTSKLWEIHQLKERDLDPRAGPGVELTRRPGADRRYQTLAFTYSRYATHPPGFEERNLSFMIAVDLLQAAANATLKTQQLCTPLHYAVNSGWTDHIDALFYFGASLWASTSDDCPAICWATGTTPYHRRALEYLRKKHGLDNWERVRETSNHTSSDHEAVPEFSWPSRDFQDWYFTDLQANVSRACLPGSTEAVKLEQALNPCALCKSISLASLRSPSGYVHAKSLKDLRRSSVACSLCRFLFTFLEKRMTHTWDRDVTQILLRAVTEPTSSSKASAFRLQLSSGCFCNVRWYETWQSRSLDFSACVGKCRSMFLEDIVFDLFTSDCK